MNRRVAGSGQKSRIPEGIALGPGEEIGLT